ncbi:alpha/beta fold hydrolase [Lutibaculum baratangense]|uniref:Putative lactone-specific esterase protein n=1 Tax=Lutibaculum baratangense AMV1 TaxID=631454 RepID=V4RIJ0_9HYPH|nr:alpha/beta hydrolase [Lutibaculum baratangense]ESR23100.1 putative lactone-specific esterase protein [Lutibaculum baratangense AMV1]
MTSSHILLVAAAVAAAFVVLLGWSALRARAIARRYPPTGRFLDLPDGTSLHFEERGPADGPAVLYLHGASGSLLDPFTAFPPDGLSAFRFVSVDRPGAGWSSRPAGKAVAHPDEQADRVVRVLDELGIEKAAIIGHSLGAATALQIALRHPSRTRALMLLGPASHPWPGGIRWYYRLAATPVLGPIFVRTIVIPVAERILPRVVANTFRPGRQTPDYAERAAVPLTLRPAAFRSTSQDLAVLKDFVERARGDYPRIAVPTVIVQGDRDQTVAPWLHAEALAQEIPNARLVWLEGVGHMPHHACPDLVLRELWAIAVPPAADAAARREAGA